MLMTLAADTLYWYPQNTVLKNPFSLNMKFQPTSEKNSPFLEFIKCVFLEKDKLVQFGEG